MPKHFASTENEAQVIYMQYIQQDNNMKNNNPIRCGTTKQYFVTALIFLHCLDGIILSQMSVKNGVLFRHITRHVSFCLHINFV